MLDRYLLRYFLAVVDCGNFSRAALQLNVAQPSLSVGIRKLETLLGAPLFQRTSKRVHLTEAGARFAPHARLIESEFNLAAASIRGAKPVASLRLGVLSTFPMAHVAAIIRGIRRDPAHERLQLVSGSERELQQKLRRAQVDVALTIVHPDADDLSGEPLFTERYAIALPRSHPLAARKSIGAEALIDDTMIVRRHCEALPHISRHFTERGIRPFFAYRGTNDEQVLALVQAGLGVTVMPESYSAPGVLRPYLTGFERTRAIGLLFAPQIEPAGGATSPTLNAIRARYRRAG